MSAKGDTSFFWSYHRACGVLGPRSGMRRPALEAPRFHRWAAGKVHQLREGSESSRCQPVLVTPEKGCRVRLSAALALFVLCSERGEGEPRGFCCGLENPSWGDTWPSTPDGPGVGREREAA